MKLKISGIIVTSSYDQDWAKKYIDKGIITPESTITSQLTDVDEDIEIVINSRGGNVFAANQIINEINDFRQRTGKTVTANIGALAASAAANIMALCSDFVRVHNNSKIMFHGANTSAIGGSGAMQDTKELLDKINGDVKTHLTTQTKLTTEQVDQWYEEGRMGWLNAQEAIDAGLADEIIDAKAENPAPANSQVVKQFADHGFDIAACAYDPEMSINELAMSQDIAELNDKLTALQNEIENKDKEIENKDKELEQRAAAEKELHNKLQHSADLANRLENKVSQLTNGLTGDSNSNTGTGDDDCPYANFAEAITAIKEDNPKMNHTNAWLKAKNDYPELWEKAKK